LDAFIVKRHVLEQQHDPCRLQRQSSLLVGSTLSGNAVAIKAANDIGIKGSEVDAVDALTLLAGRDLKVSSAAETVNQSHLSESPRNP